MSVALLCGRTVEETKKLSYWIEGIAQALLKIDSSITVEVWPEITNPDNVECAIVWHYPLGELNKFSNLKGIFSVGAGVDHIFADTSLPKNVPITRIVDPYMAIDMMHYAVTATMNYVRRFPDWRESQLQCQWQQQHPTSYRDKTIGVMGLGYLGGFVAKELARLQLKTIGWSKSQKQIDGVHCYCGVDGFDRFLQQVNIVICLLPLTPATRQILNRKAFAKMPRGAYLINMARGRHVQEQDLLAAMEQGQLSGACLDVFSQEPLPPEHPFWAHPNITVTPHIAAVTNPVTAAQQFYENYQRIKHGQKLINRVKVERGY